MEQDRYSQMSLEELTREYDRRVCEIATSATIEALQFIKQSWLAERTQEERDAYALKVAARLRQDDRVQRLVALHRSESPFRL